MYTNEVQMASPSPLIWGGECTHGFKTHWFLLSFNNQRKKEKRKLVGLLVIVVIFHPKLSISSYMD